jgi:hypothetical protein
MKEVQVAEEREEGRKGRKWGEEYDDFGSRSLYVFAFGGRCIISDGTMVAVA